MTGEPLAPAKKKKQVCDVCGAPISPEPENKSTRQKRKSKFMTCAERPSRPRQRTITHAKKEKASLRRVRSAHLARAREPKHTPKKKKQVCDVCGAPASPAPARPPRPKASVPCRPSPRWQQKSPTLQKPKPPQKFFPHPRDFRYNIRIGK